MIKQSKSSTVFGRRLFEARTRMGVAQDKLGVSIGIDESCSSARISRYESGIHEPKILIVEKLAKALDVPLAYFYCDDDCLAEVLCIYSALDNNQRNKLLLQARNILDCKQ